VGQDLRPANLIKAELIDFLLKEQYDLIANEVPFLKTSRWADLIAIQKGQTIGFEIKSEKDNLQGLSEQLSDYLKVFNAVYLVITKKFFDSAVLNRIPGNVGIIHISENIEPIRKRKAVFKTLLDKSALTTMLWRKDLEKLAPSKKNEDIDILRNYVIENCSTKSVQMQITEALKSRYGNSYKLFLNDRGNYTTVEDLHIITRIKKSLALPSINIA
jgi:hypothetical protein